jgi:hypothetical protein
MKHRSRVTHRDDVHLVVFVHAVHSVHEAAQGSSETLSPFPAYTSYGRSSARRTSAKSAFRGVHPTIHLREQEENSTLSTKPGVPTVGGMAHEPNSPKRPRKPKSKHGGKNGTENEIGWTFVPRIPPGEYFAYTRSSAIYRDKQFKRWVCAVQFDVLDRSLDIIARLTWYLNLGSRERPRAGRRGNYWLAWIKANSGPPKRNDRLSCNVFEKRYATVRVADTEKLSTPQPFDPDCCYSVVRDVIQWETSHKRNEAETPNCGSTISL